MSVVGRSASGTIRELTALRQRAVWARVDVLLTVSVATLLVWVRATATDVWGRGVGGYGLGVWVVISIFLQLLQHWLLWLRVGIQYEQVSWSSASSTASHVFVQPQLHRGLPEVVQLRSDDGLWFEYQFRKYRFHASHGKFAPLRFPLAQPHSWYLSRKGIASDENELHTTREYGRNELHMPPPTFASLFLEHALAPFFVFQIFCVGLWCLDEYWYYSLFTLFMLVTLEAVVVMQRVRQHSSLRAMRPIPADSLAFRRGMWRRVPAADLLPGDLVSVRAPTKAQAEERRQQLELAAAASSAGAVADPSRMARALMGMGATAANEQLPDPAVVPADILLLSGTVVVNEAMLTGESVPQMKEAATEDEASDEARDLRRAEEEATAQGGAAIAGAPKGVHAAAIAPSDAEDDGGSTTEDADEAHTSRWLQGVSRHVLFAGTTLVTSASTESGALGVPAPPDGGAVGFVLRTGFYSSQGDLMRTILFSTRRITVENSDAYYFIACLLVFALLAAGYVLREGLAQEGRDTWKLVLHCILVVTSVVPPELPVELSMAVNNSLAALARKRIFCTEPFRIPNAGFVDVCCFDKTGTLTSDQLLVRGIAYAPGDLGASGARPTRAAATHSSAGGRKIGVLQTPEAIAALAHAGVVVVPPAEASRDSWTVLAGCHGVVLADGELAGDPLECSALRSIGWTVDSDGVSRQSHRTDETATASVADTSSTSMVVGTAKDSIRILRRWPFTSASRRMTTIVEGPSPGMVRVLCKGAPETIVSLLASPPSSYLDAATALSLTGARVLALASKPLSVKPSVAGHLSREDAERDLAPAGFLVLECPLKSDSLPLVRDLRHAGQTVTMITGDHPLTAVAVARAVGILESTPIAGVMSEPRRTPADVRSACIILEAPRDPAPGAPWAAALQWQVVTERSGSAPIVTSAPFVADTLRHSGGLQEAFKNADVCVTGSALTVLFAAVDSDPSVQQVIDRLCLDSRVFARVAPAQKERIITSMNALGLGTLMCGDGTNDVGALKQANVGVSIVSDPSLEDKLEVIEEERKAVLDAVSSARSAMSAPSAATTAASPNDQALRAVETALRRRREDKDRRDAAAAQSAEERRKRRQGSAYDSDSDDEASKRRSQGKKNAAPTTTGAGKPAGWSDPVALAKQQLRLRGVPEDSAEGRQRLVAAQMQKELADMEREIAMETSMVQFGDASIAAPFTSKRPSPTVAMDIMLQGRCTLITTHQMFRILAVNSLIASYDLSVLYLYGARKGDTQATVLGMAITAFFMMLSFTRPLEKLSRAKPERTVFVPHLLISVFGQFLIHLVILITAVQLCAPYVEFVPMPFAPTPVSESTAALGAAPAVLVSDEDAIAAAAAAAAAAAIADDLPSSSFNVFGDTLGRVLADSSSPIGDSAESLEAAYGAGSSNEGGVEQLTMDGAFKPNVLNTVVFLLSVIQQATTFAVNYRGRPFMQDLHENVFFSRGIAVLYGAAFLAAYGWTDLCEMLQLVPMPTESMTWQIIGLMAADVGCCMLLEFTVRRVFNVART